MRCRSARLSGIRCCLARRRCIRWNGCPLIWAARRCGPSARTATLVAGFAAQAASGGRPRRVIGIDASAKPTETRGQVTRIARHTARLIGAGRELDDGEIELNENYHAGTYGIPDDATLDAMRLAARTEGMITDPVYEGKSMAGLIDLISRREIDPTSTVLYAHLGGQPALNAYSALFS